MKENIFFPMVGGIAGASVYSTIGGVGIVGGFGGLGIGITGMTATGTIIGSAVYGAVKGLEDVDTTAFIATGLGAVSGIGTSVIIGGVGVTLGGSAFSIGMCSMAAMGGVFGLGIYGLANMFGSNSSTEPIDAVFNRMEERIAYEEAYFQAMLELDSTFVRSSCQRQFNELELDEELELLKSQIKAKHNVDSTLNIDNSFSIHNTVENEFINIESESLDIELKNNFIWKSIRILTGHTGTVNSLAIQENIIASASEDNTVSLWNLDIGKRLYSFYEASAVHSIAINSKLVIAGNQKRNITSWNLVNKNLDRIYSTNYNSSSYSNLSNKKCHDELIHSFILSNDGRTLFSSSGDKTIRAWNTNTGQLKYTFVDHTDLILSLVITSCDRFLISGSADKTIKIWDLEHLSSKPQTIFAHDNWVTSLAITPDNKYLVSGGTDKIVKLWEFPNLKQVYSLENQSEIWSVAINPDGLTIVSGSSDDIVTLWDLATGNLLQTIKASSPIIFNQNGKYLITSNRQNQIVIWQRINTTDRIANESNIPWWIVLGIEANATKKEIKESYYDLARKYHPDINSSMKAKKIMQIINQAYCAGIKV